MDKNGKKEVKQEKFSLNDGQTQGFLTAQKEGVKKILGEEISEGVLNNFLILNEVFADLGAKGDLLENEKTQSRKGGSSTSAFFNCCPSDNKNKEEDVKMDFEMLNQVILLKQLINGAYIFENEEDKKQLDGLFLRSDINWNMCDEQGISLLGFALSDNKNHALVSKLIENGADVNFSDKHGYTPLMYAVKYPYMVEYLLQNGANVHQKDNQGETALHKSINSLVDYETVLLLLDLHILEKTAAVFGVLHERVEPVLLANGLTGYILLLLQYAQEGQYGIIGRLWVGELLQDFTDRGLLQVPQDVHYLQLSPSKFIAPFHYS